MSGQLDDGLPEGGLYRQLCDTYGTFQGLRLVGVATLSEDGNKPEAKRIRYTIGYRETINQLPPMSIEHLVPNTGEPHIQENELAHQWAAFDGARTGSYQRRYIAAANPARRLSRLSISPGFGNAMFRQLVECIFHVGPEGLFNQELVGMLPELDSINPGEVAEGDEFQGFPTRRLKMVADCDGVPSGLTISFACGENPFILSVTDLHGHGQACAHWLMNREIIKLERRGGYLLPTHAKWWQPEPHPFTCELVVDSVQRISKDFRGLWNFDSCSGIRVTDQAARRMTRIPFTVEEEAKIKNYLSLR